MKILDFPSTKSSVTPKMHQIRLRLELCVKTRLKVHYVSLKYSTFWYTHDFPRLFVERFPRPFPSVNFQYFPGLPQTKQRSHCNRSAVNALMKQTKSQTDKVHWLTEQCGTMSEVRIKIYLNTWTFFNSRASEKTIINLPLGCQVLNKVTWIRTDQVSDIYSQKPPKISLVNEIDRRTAISTQLKHTRRL